MCIICKGNYDEKMEYLDCSHCPNIERIPETLINLKKLYCWDCPRIERIPETLVNLKVLDCENCPNLRELPVFEKLEYLFCSYCPLLQTVSCLRYCYMEHYNCSWLSHPNNLGYNYNIQQLTILQKHLRKYLHYRKFIRYTNSKAFIEWIYAPERIGGRLSKKSIETLFQKTKNLN